MEDKQMEKSIKIKNKEIDSFLDLHYFIPNAAQKFDEYYSDVHKERLIDYPMAVLSALVRMSLD
jgi:hypothetical protein